MRNVLLSGHGSGRRRLHPPSEADIALARLSRTDAGPDGVARRRFLQGSLALLGGSGLHLMPGMFDHLAAAATPLAPTDRILVTVFLSGGNDHLNTLVPAEDGAYHAARGSLAVSVNGATAVGDRLHLHPNLARLKNRFDAGQVAFVRGVGESSDDHSHFTSMATWFSGIQNMVPATGWLGRYQDGAGLGALGSVSIGWSGVPMMLQGSHSSAVALPPNGSLFGADREEAWERLAFEAISDLGSSGGGMGPHGSTVAGAYGDAVDTAESIAPAFVSSLAEDGLARELGLAAQVINLDLGTQVVNVDLGGFDHHDAQRPDHDDLLAQLDAGIDAFWANLAPAFAARTTMLIMSEFGRRVAANSTGTDHGTAGLMMLVGPRVNGGLHGQQPSLSDLDNRGDMHHHLDFRSVYASVLGQWFGADDQEILGATYPQLDLLGEGNFNLFLDVDSRSYYAPAISWLASTGITTGTGPGQFSPDGTVTRGQMATFLWRYRGRPAGAPPAGFIDVPSGQYYSEAIDWLASTGITTGTGFGRFSPEDPVTRGQMAAFLWRLEGSPGGSAPAGFVDVPPGRFYSDAVDWLLARGITTGTQPGYFSPDEVVTRGQMATFLWRLAGSPA